MFTCACALFGFVSNAEAQVTGDIVTIRNSNNYLAVNEAGTEIVNVAATDVDERCYWIVSVDGDTYTFQSVKGNQLYLNIPTSNNSKLLLGDRQEITKNEDNIFYVSTSTRTYYIYRDGTNWESNRNNSTSLTLAVIPNQGHKYTNVDPAVGETSAFNTITLTTDADIMSQLHFGKDFEFVNDSKVSFTFTSENGATETSIMGQGVGAKRIDDRTLEITIPSNLGAGTYTLSLAAGAILGTDDEPFAAKTYTWTVKPHTFASISPIQCHKANI